MTCSLTLYSTDVGGRVAPAAAHPLRICTPEDVLPARVWMGFASGKIRA
jgi:hypothetical protein